MRFFICVILFLLSLSFSFADSITDGSLIVTYQTDQQGERLDRVRFWLKSPDLVQKLYPKDSEYVEDALKKTRTIAVENLKPGSYSINFIIPNKDLNFEDVFEKNIQIKSGEITRIEQAFKKREIVFHDVDRLYEIFDWLSFLAGTYSKEMAISYYEKTYRPQGIFGGSLDIETNLKNARWEIYYGDKVIVRGSGDASNIVLTPGTNYLIRAEEMEGYTANVYPPKNFTIRARSSFIGRITYLRSYGSIFIGAKVPDGDSVRVRIDSDRSVNNYSKEIQPINGLIEWDIDQIPTGTYTVTFAGKDQSLNVSPITVAVGKDEKINLKPDLRNNHDLTVHSNVEEAIYTLIDDSGQRYQGKGKSAVFHGVPQGHYTLQFSSSNPKFLVSPSSKQIYINNELETVNVQYKTNGLLTVTTNATNPFVTIIAKSSASPTIKEELKGAEKSFSLSPGEYQVIVSKSPRSNLQKSETILVKENENKEFKIDFNESKDKTASINNAQVVIISNINENKFKLQKKNGDSILNSQYQGKYVSVPIDAKTAYEIVFDKIDNYTTPLPISIELAPGEHRILRVEYVPIQKLALVSEGQVLLGDVFNEGADDEKPLTAFVNQFYIGVYDVTNVLYANWLTKAVKEGKLIYLTDSEKKGQVIDNEGWLICKTAISDSTSQIVPITDSLEGLQFKPIAGKENHPVIVVTWYGANAYALDNDSRLPTEAEWEKAAGMANTGPEMPLKKYRYGFSQDSIDRTWANYKWNDDPIKQFKVLTSEVGFYDGHNLLPLSISDNAQVQTHDAKSPVGAYDMSGNVFQWIADWYGPRKTSSNVVNNPKGPEMGTKKIAKGGCYDSLSSELRVSARLPLNPEHCDAYTGFRVAK